MYSVYFARSLRNKKVYVGYTSKEPEDRIKEHNSGSNSWSKANKPLKLLYYEKFLCEEDAKLREKFYKSGVGKKLKKIIAEHFVTMYNKP